MRSGLLTGGAWVVSIIAAVPLFSVLYMLFVEGGSRFGLEIFTELPPAGFEMGGGFGNAIVGTLVMVGIAALISIPVGILAAVYLGELDPNSKLATRSRFLAKVLTGFPSILAGVFAYGAVVLLMGTYSAIAGGVALSVLMLPTVVLTAEEAMKMVPQRMKDAAYGMGCTRAQVIWKVVLPTGLPGILTGVMLAVAGAAGESAPLLFTALFSNYYMSSLHRTDGVPVDPDLQLFGHALREPDRTGLGGVPGPGSDRVDLQHPQPPGRQTQGIEKSGNTIMNAMAAETQQQRSPRTSRCRTGRSTATSKRSSTATSWPSGTATCRSRRTRSPVSSARPGAARARCSVASTG